MASSNSDEYQMAGNRLYDAAVAGDLKLLKKIAADLKSGGETLAETFLGVRSSEDATLLHFAAGAGRVEICEYLIETLKLDVNLQDEQGSTPLHYAITFERYPVVEYLLNIGANPDKGLREDGVTPLHFAIVKGNIEIVNLLIERGADIEATDSRLGTALHFAATYGNKDALIALLKQNPDPNALKDQFCTPLLLAIVENSFDCMELLIKAGAGVNVESCGYTPLHCAATRGHPEAVRLMLKYGADPDAIDWSGLTLLEKCAAMGLHEECKILFPVTKKIPYINDWTIKGIINYMNSYDALLQRTAKRKEYILKSKSMGEAYFRKEDYPNAIVWYSQALWADRGDARILSNRSLCQAKLKNGMRALVDAQSCIKVDPYWYKSHYRAGVAYALLKYYAKAAAAFSDALKLAPDNKEIQDALREVVTEQVSSSLQIGTSNNK